MTLEQAGLILQIILGVIAVGTLVYFAGGLRQKLAHLDEAVTEIRGDMKQVVDVAKKVAVLEADQKNLASEQYRMRDKIHEHSGQIQKLYIKTGLIEEA